MGLLPYTLFKSDANIVVAPSDHLILKEGEFLAAIEKGLDFVSKYDKLLTLGIKPNRPETGYGYIQIAEQEGDNFYKVKTFTEKPELELAKVLSRVENFIGTPDFSCGTSIQSSKQEKLFFQN